MTIRPAAAALLLAATGCTGPSRQSRIEAKLEQAGIRHGLAHCLAPRLARDLSDDQLRALAVATKVPGEGHGAKALRRRLAAIDDPDTREAVSRAAFACTILG